MTTQHWPAWYYGPGRKKDIFQNEDEVPEGWADSPGGVAPPPEVVEDPTLENYGFTREEAFEALYEAGVQVRKNISNAKLASLIGDNLDDSVE